MTIFFVLFLGFLEKNRDSFSGDVREMISRSQNKYLIDLFKTELNIDTINKKNMTLSTKFRTSLDSLMRTLSMCHPFFVRCIKPNDEKVPNVSMGSEVCCYFIANFYFILWKLVKDSNWKVESNRILD